MTTPIEVKEQNFSEEVLNADTPVLVDFWAAWCGPCRQFAPVFKKLAEETSGLLFATVNVDDNQGLAAQYGIKSIPSVILFDKGSKVGVAIGPQTADDLKREFSSYFSQ